MIQKDKLANPYISVEMCKEKKNDCKLCIE